MNQWYFCRFTELETDESGIDINHLLLRGAVQLCIALCLLSFSTSIHLWVGLRMAIMRLVLCAEITDDEYPEVPVLDAANNRRWDEIWTESKQLSHFLLTQTMIVIGKIKWRVVDMIIIIKVQPFWIHRWKDQNAHTGNFKVRIMIGGGGGGVTRTQVCYPPCSVHQPLKWTLMMAYRTMLHFCTLKWHQTCKT